MDQDVGTLVVEPPALLWVGLQPTSTNVQYISQGGPFALVDLQGADLTRALSVLPSLSTDHSGIGTVCGELAVSAHANMQCLMGFGGNPERAHAVISSAEEACKALVQVELNSINHSSEVSYACTSVRMADGIVSMVQEYHNTHEHCTNQICTSFPAPVQGALTDLWRRLNQVHHTLTTELVRISGSESLLGVSMVGTPDNPWHVFMGTF